MLGSLLSTVGDPSCKRVLVVEDDGDSGELLGLLLEDAGYQACVVHSVAAAMKTAVVVQPHVVLIDLGLPDGDGHELLAALQKDPALGHCRFIATTGHGDQETILRSLELGFDEHLTKPLQQESVLAAVARSAAQAGNLRLAEKR